MTSVEDLSAPAPLRLPAILQNPTNSALRQVEAHNAQQRERATARREARSTTSNKEGGRNGMGKRVIRRLDNASFASNPHIVQPSRSDYAPPIPLQARSSSRPSASFPPGTVSRSAAIPSTVPPERDPRSSDSINGAFTLSLKGTRALLRKRGAGAGAGGGGGRRVEQFVGTVEKEIRGWLDGDYGLNGFGHGNGNRQVDGEGADLDASESGPWRVIDNTLCEYPVPVPVPVDSSTSGPSSSSPTATATTRNTSAQSGSTNPPHPTVNGRRMPLQHQITALLPPLPTTTTNGSDDNNNGASATAAKSTRQGPCVLEYSRSPAHLSWFIPESFERLVVHLISRYYELLSWSEAYTTTSNEVVRLTHIIVPSIAKPTLGNRRNNDGYTLLTPETSELSGQSGPESVGGAFTSSESGSESGAGSDGTAGSGSDTATERGDGDDDGGSVDGYEVADTTITASEPPLSLGVGVEVVAGFGELRISDPHQVTDTAGIALERTISNTSSAYASSEGSNFASDTDYTSGLGDSYVLPPRGSVSGAAGAAGVPPPSSGWSDFGGSDFGEMPALPAVAPSSGSGFGFGYSRGLGTGALGGFGKKGWESKPTFFEYLYGA
ncbi:hypothetical protein IAT40_002020 [Kwoniella sp. CBS 6097]